MLRLERLESRENPSGPELIDPTAILGGNPTTVPPATSPPPVVTPPGTPPPAVDWSWLLGSGATGGVPIAPPINLLGGQ